MFADVRLNSMQYSQLREKIQNPIRTARSVVIQQSLSDCFISAFTEQVQRNGVYRTPPGSPVGEPKLNYYTIHDILDSLCIQMIAFSCRFE